MNLASFSSRAVAVCMPTSILPPGIGTGGERRLTAEGSSTRTPTSNPWTCCHHRHRHRYNHSHRYGAEWQHCSSPIFLLASPSFKKRGFAAITDTRRAGSSRRGALPCGVSVSALGSRSRCGQPSGKIDCDALLLRVRQVDDTPPGGCWMQLAKAPTSAGLNVSDKGPNGRGWRKRWLSVVQLAAARDDERGPFLGRSEGATSLRSSSGIEDRSFAQGESLQVEENPQGVDKPPAPKRQDNNDHQGSDLLYFAKFAGICFVAAATIKYGSVALPSLAKPNLLSALIMVTVPMGVSAIALVSASAEEKGDRQM